MTDSKIRRIVIAAHLEWLVSELPSIL
jgi:hypothetical protein